VQPPCFIQALEDWAAICRLACLAGADQVLERAVKSVQVSDFGLYLHQLGLRLPLHIATASCRADTET